MSEHVAWSGGLTVEPPPMVRVAGLPVAALHRLRFEEAFAAAERLARLHAWLRAEGDALSGALYPVIGALPDGTVKPVLVGLRRALHQVRPPRAGEWNEHVAAVIPSSITVRVRVWLSWLGEHERRSAALPGVLAAEETRKRAELREVVGDPRFRRALSQASPALFAELTKWLADPNRRLRRQSLVRLTKYVARVAAKTSPYSTFTASGVGVWTADGPAVEFARDAADVGVLELDRIALQRLVRAICDDPRVSGALPVRVNPSAIFSGETVSFLGPPPRESIITMPVRPAVRECLRIVGADPHCTTGRLRDRLAGAGADPEGVDRVIAKLVAAGLLERQLPVADQAADPLGDLSDWVATSATGDPGDVLALIESIGGLLRADIPVRDVAGHCLRSRMLSEAVADLADRVGEPDGSTMARSRNLFHDNAVFTAPVVRCAMSRWRPALEALNVVRRWLAAFDPALPMRLAIGAFSRERFGPGAHVSLLTMHRAIHEEFLGEDRQGPSGIAAEVVRYLQVTPLGAGAELAESAIPRVRELYRTQERARQAMLEGPCVDGAVQVDPSKIAALAASWPRWLGAPESLGCYVQVVEDPQRPHLVLNAAHAGYGRGRNRLRYLIRKAAGATTPDEKTMPDEKWRRPPYRPLRAELSGAYFSSLNVRLPSVPYEIDYPFTVSDRPAAERIKLGDLAVVHDPPTDSVRLVTVRSGMEVVPLHLGMMADVLLPPVARLLVQTFGPTYFLHPSTTVLAAAADLVVPRTVVRYPRVAMGHVIVQRSRWVAPTSCVPARQGETDAEYLRRLITWLGRHDIPARCFVRAWPRELSDDAFVARRDRWVMEKARKPVYIDFANWYLILAFERMLRDCGPFVVFEEALPTPDDAVVAPHGRAATEFLVEISGRRAGHA